MTSSAPRASLATVLLIVFIDLLGFGIIMPLLPFYVPNYNEHAIQVTLLFSIYSACQLIGAPILGALSDRIGRRPVLAFSQLGSAFGYALLAAATFVEDPHLRLAVVYASRIIDGFTGGNISTAQAYISDVTDAKGRASAMGKMGAAFGIGFVLGPAVGGILGHFSPAWPAIAAAALSLIAAVCTFAFVVEPARHRPHATEADLFLHPRMLAPIFRNRMLAHLLLIMATSMAAFVMMEATFTLYLLHIYPTWEKFEVGLFFAGVGVVIAIVQGGLVGRLTRRFGEWPLAIAGPLFVAAGMAGFVALTWIPLMLMLVLAGFFNAAGRSLQQPTLNALISKSASPSQQGLVFGLSHSLMSLARVIGPIVAGLVYPFLRNTGAYVTAGVIVTGVAVWTWALGRSSLQASASPVDGPQFEPQLK